LQQVVMNCCNVVGGMDTECVMDLFKKKSVRDMFVSSLMTIGRSGTGKGQGLGETF
jgi:hypothetical protein